MNHQRTNLQMIDSKVLLLQFLTWPGFRPLHRGAYLYSCMLWRQNQVFCNLTHCCCHIAFAFVICSTLITAVNPCLLYLFLLAPGGNFGIMVFDSHAFCHSPVPGLCLNFFLCWVRGNHFASFAFTLFMQSEPLDDAPQPSVADALQTELQTPLVTSVRFKVKRWAGKDQRRPTLASSSASNFVPPTPKCPPLPGPPRCDRWSDGFMAHNYRPHLTPLSLGSLWVQTMEHRLCSTSSDLLRCIRWVDSLWHPVDWAFIDLG